MRKKNRLPCCIVCKCGIRPAVHSIDSKIKKHISFDDSWEMPKGAVVFSGGGSFGSTIYDTMIDGIAVKVLICDKCLRKNKKYLNEYKTI